MPNPDKGVRFALGRHDFATVETIEFYEDEDAELPPPMTLKEVRTRFFSNFKLMAWQHERCEGRE